MGSSEYNFETLLRERWIPSLVQLVKEVAERIVINITVHVSIYESGRVDGTTAPLTELGASLKEWIIDYTIKRDEETRPTAVAKRLTFPCSWPQKLYGKYMRRFVDLADVRKTKR